MPGNGSFGFVPKGGKAGDVLTLLTDRGTVGWEGVNTSTSLHADLTDRDGADCHPIAAISGLTEALAGLSLDLPNVANLRQMDIAVPGKFAANITASALLTAGKDYAIWQIEPCNLRKLMVRAFAADSGSIPASVYLVVNGAQVGDAITAYSSVWSTVELSGTLNTGDAIELGVSATGTNADSEGLRAVIVAEVA